MQEPHLDLTVGAPGASRPAPASLPDLSGTVHLAVVDDRPTPEFMDGLDLVDRLAFESGHGGAYHGPPDCQRLVVARTDKAVVGYALALQMGDERGDPWYIDTVAVVPTHQRDGLGTRLVQALARELLDLGVSSVAATALVGDVHAMREVWMRHLGFESKDGTMWAATAHLAAADA